MINDFLDFCHKNDGRQINKLVSSRKKWKEVEDELLLKGIRKYGNQWSKIQEEVPTKDSKQCQARWKILKNKEETMDRLEALGDQSEMENQNHKIKKVKISQREIPRRYNPHFDYNEESSSESMHLQQFQKALIKQPNQLSLLQQQHKKEQIQKQAQSQYQNVWNAMDDKMLWAAFKIYKGVWKQITSRFQEKNPQSCMERYQFVSLQIINVVTLIKKNEIVRRWIICRYYFIYN
ncbi:unnamed protein product [Paramecium primaurelia]|uniref:Uncharacterized protein n=1 Tax=Paramecium primaurelia TaxID=5886 RepID=A0A8S1PH24_PARPR|nr:unnamed protein product [Paramecium primaurelia]